MLRSRDRDIETLQKDYNLTRKLSAMIIFQVQTHKKHTFIKETNHVKMTHCI